MNRQSDSRPSFSERRKAAVAFPRPVVTTFPILMYHKVDEIPAGTRCLDNYVLPEQFEAQLAALSRWGYTFITLEDWLEFRAGRRKLPLAQSQSRSTMGICQTTM